VGVIWREIAYLFHVLSNKHLYHRSIAIRQFNKIGILLEAFGKIAKYIVVIIEGDFFETNKINMV